MSRNILSPPFLWESSASCLLFVPWIYPSHPAMKMPVLTTVMVPSPCSWISSWLWSRGQAIGRRKNGWLKCLSSWVLWTQGHLSFAHMEVFCSADSLQASWFRWTLTLRGGCCLTVTSPAHCTSPLCFPTSCTSWCSAPLQNSPWNV